MTQFLFILNCLHLLRNSTTYSNSRVHICRRGEGGRGEGGESVGEGKKPSHLITGRVKEEDVNIYSWNLS